MKEGREFFESVEKGSSFFESTKPNEEFFELHNPNPDEKSLTNEEKCRAFFEPPEPAKPDEKSLTNEERCRAFFEPPEPDEEFLKLHNPIRQEMNRIFFTGSVSQDENDKETNDSTDDDAVLMLKPDDRIISVVVKDLKQVRIEVSPETICEMMKTYAGKGYSLVQIAALVEVECEKTDTKDKKDFGGHRNELSQFNSYRGMSR